MQRHHDWIDAFQFAAKIQTITANLICLWSTRDTRITVETSKSAFKPEFSFLSIVSPVLISLLPSIPHIHIIHTTRASITHTFINIQRFGNDWDCQTTQRIGVVGHHGFPLIFLFRTTKRRRIHQYGRMRSGCCCVFVKSSTKSASVFIDQKRIQTRCFIVQFKWLEVNQLKAKEIIQQKWRT